MTPDNILIQIAILSERGYVTPEDVAYSVKTHGVAATRLALLEIAGRKLCGLEDSSLCFFVAWKGDDERDEQEERDVRDWANLREHKDAMQLTGLLIQLRSPAAIENIRQEIETSDVLSPWGVAIAQRLQLANVLEDRVEQVKRAATWISVFDDLPPMDVFVEVKAYRGGNLVRSIDCVRSPKGGIAGMESWLYFGIGRVQSWRYFFNPLTGERLSEGDF